MDALTYYLGMQPLGAVAIVLSTVLLYFSFALLLRWYGQRMYASPSSLDLAVVTVLGAIVGRAILGQVPTLSGGLLALAVQMVPVHLGAIDPAGVRNPEDVALAILEQNGRFSVLRAGEKIHPAALTGVRHANELRDRLQERSH